MQVIIFSGMLEQGIQKKGMNSMEFENRDEFIIKKYQQEEEMMIQLYVQWCLNHQLDPVALYQRAYPGQAQNETLLKTVEEAGQEDMEIGNDTIMDVLQMFGNDDLAFAVAEEIQKFSKK
jgi:hypothetical protein